MFSTNIAKIKKFILTQDDIIKKIEYFRGLYRYPNKMAGRIFDLTKVKKDIDIVVIAAHPDDEILGVGTTLLRARLRGENIVVLFVTNGSYWNKESWRIKKSETLKRAMTRYYEASKALSLIRIPQENIICLGYPDAGSHRYVKNIALDIHFFLSNLNPNKVYVHCIEGGHSDHDTASFIVKFVCREMGLTNVFEWTEYRPKQPIGSQNVTFLPFESQESEESKIEITECELNLKKKMLSYHKSQNVERFFRQGEALRRANLLDINMELIKYCQLPKKKILCMENALHSIKNNIAGRNIQSNQEKNRKHYII